MQIDRERARAAFGAYVASYDPDDPKIALKIEHTWRVAALAERIARSLLGYADAAPAADGPAGDGGTRTAAIASEEDVDLVWLLGLLHDVGRFEQVRRYGTFNDAESVSHAALGAQVLFDGFEGAPATIRDYVADGSEDALIRTAVALHSAWHLPEGLGGRTRAFCQILRDADKIDILKVNCVNPVEAIYGFPREVLLASELSEDATSWFWRHSTIPREARRFPADILLGHVCFAWELCYPESYRALVEQGCVFQMMERPFVRDEVRAEFARMEAHLKGWLAEKGCLHAS